MTLFTDPVEDGFVIRLVRIYREKRSPIPVLKTTSRMPRRAAWQIAWHQARNARGLGTQE